MSGTCFVKELGSRYRFALLATCMFLVLGADKVYATDSVTISADNLARVSSSSEFIRIPGLAELVKRIDTDETLGLIVHYPGGEAGQVWGGRIESWLIALGLSSKRIQLEVGASSTDGVEIVLGPVQ